MILLRQGSDYIGGAAKRQVGLITKLSHVMLTSEVKCDYAGNYY